MNSSRGFTLLEVMIAITIFVVVATSISRTTSQSVDTILYLQDKTLASWVAENRLAEIQLNALPETGQNTDVRQQMGREWIIRTQVENTPLANTRRITVSVADVRDKDAFLISLVSIMGAHG